MMTRASTATAGRVEFLNPDGLARNPGFSNVAVVPGRVWTIYIGGQDAVDPEGNIVGIGDIIAQTEEGLRNLRTALAAAVAGPEHVVKWNAFILDGPDFTSGRQPISGSPRGARLAPDACSVRVRQAGEDGHQRHLTRRLRCALALSRTVTTGHRVRRRFAGAGLQR